MFRPALISQVMNFHDVLAVCGNRKAEPAVRADGRFVVGIYQLLAGGIERSHDRVKRLAEAIRDDFDRYPLAFPGVELVVIKAEFLASAIDGHWQIQSLR